jgi:hypothetical protein
MRYTPESPMDNPACLETQNVNHPSCLKPAVSPRYAAYNAMLDRVASRHPDRVRTIDLSDKLCPDTWCKCLVDGLIVRHDGLHWSKEGNRWVVPHLESKLADAGVVFTL